MSSRILWTERARRDLLDNFRIVYQFRDHQIVVLTVFESHRQLVESDLDGKTTV